MKYFDIKDIFVSLKGLIFNEIKAFEEEFADYIGCNYAIGTSFGRTALYAGLKAINAENREVIIPAYTCTVVRHAVCSAGAYPRFVDVEWEDMSFNINDLQNNITQKTVAIVLTHYFGRVARNTEQVIEIAKKNNLFLIEDCAHSLGAEYGSKKIGTLGDFAIFSLTKNTINFGGGVLVTKSDNIYKNARKVLNETKVSIKRRIVDFPLVFAYGLEQMIDKLIFDRVNKNIFKWWIILIPRLLLIIRRYLITIIKAPLALKMLKSQKKTKTVTKEKVMEISVQQIENIHLERVMAAIGRTQLRKINFLNEQRCAIVERLSKIKNCHFDTSDKLDCKDVCTYLVLRFTKENIFNVIELFKKHGILLRPTWPTHQKLWDYQQTENVKSIENNILTYTINPMLNDREIKQLTSLINNNDLFLK